MPSALDRLVAGHSIAFKLSIFYALFFGLLAALGGVLLYQMVQAHVLDELDDDIARQENEFARVVMQGEMPTLSSEFDAYESSCGKTDCFARLLDEKGNLLLSSDMSLWPKLTTPEPLLRKHAGRSSLFSTLDLPDDRRKARLLSVFIPAHGYLQLGVSLGESESLFDHFRRYGLMILVTMMTLGALIGWILARKAMAGVSAVTQASRSVAEGHFSERVVVSGHGHEIDDLVRSFNLMVERVQTVMAEMRQVNDNIAHDLRSPLTRIRGMAERAATYSESSIEEVVLAGDIVEECDRLMQMINTMLDISEAETGVGRLHRNTVDMNELVDQAGELFAGVAEDKGQTLTVDHAEARHVVQGDRRKLQRVIANLIDNAIKYTPDSGQIRVNLRREPGRICVEVSDTGIGIAPENLPRIFERFYRCDESRHQAGNGLGLSLAQAIARAHGGGLSVDSLPGRGSVFRLVLPS